ncbi:hypothetical protein EYF80_058837 [Liparis tanakae]|uniref:Uncharacterized protein n=1 Tax=Liparis tanakae TaxID=230148 RepID=A0A4Z2EQX6_9TELE|nr:hypothetical protein EYF80_058837 [Liparis tanakae]
MGRGLLELSSFVTSRSKTHQQSQEVGGHQHVEDPVPAACRQQPGQQGAERGACGAEQRHLNTSCPTCRLRRR